MFDSGHVSIQSDFVEVIFVYKYNTSDYCSTSRSRFGDVRTAPTHCFRDPCRFIRFNVPQCNPELALPVSYYSMKFWVSRYGVIYSTPRGETF